MSDLVVTPRRGIRNVKPLELALLMAGLAGLATSLVTHRSEAIAAIGQVSPAFILVTGLLLIGMVAQDDGLFEYTGQVLAHRVPGGLTLLFGSGVVITVVTAILNLDTTVVFLTPVFVSLAARRGDADSPLVYLCLFLANAGSLFLPGSNLTNLIVLEGGTAGGQFLADMWPTATVAVVSTVAVVAWFWRGKWTTAFTGPPVVRPHLGSGLVAVLAAFVLVLVLPEAAVPVALVGAATATWRMVRGKERLRRVVAALGIPTLLGLFSIAVAFGTLGRIWSGVTLLSGSGIAAHIITGTVAALVINNLPAAALLGAVPGTDAYALLIGLNIGPNLFVTGSLAWFLWLKAARGAGANPSVARAARIGLVAVPVTVIAAGVMLHLTRGW